MNENQIKFPEDSSVRTYTTFNPKVAEEEGVFYIKGHSNIKNVLLDLIESKYLNLINKHLTGIKMVLKVKNGFINSFVIQGVPGYGKDFDEVYITNNTKVQVFLYLLYLVSALEGVKRGNTDVGIVKLGISSELAEDISKLEFEIEKSNINSEL